MISSPIDWPAEFDHVAHAGPRISDLFPLYQDLLGGRVLFGGANPRVGYRALHIAFPSGGRVELLEPIPGSDFLTKFLEDRPRGGIHHLTFRVQDLRDCLDRAAACGIEVFGANFDLEWQHEAFVHPRDAHGTLVQLIERLKPPPPPFSKAELAEFIATSPSQ